jgi:hydroxymethylbilane synthase
MNMLIRLGTRQSPLALWQAEYVSGELRARGHEVQLVKIITSGDVSTTPLGQSGGQGVFTKEIQRALLDGRCDLAVHSLKDLPTELIPELHLAAVPIREDASDCLVSNRVLFADLPIGATVGTGSPRRKAQLLHVRADLRVMDIRGNVDTRLRKQSEGQYDAILLAYAGMHRLKLNDHITEKLSTDLMLPAVGQAALGLETRSGDEQTIQAIQSLDHPATHLAILAERSLLRSMRAGCLAPLAAHSMLVAIPSSTSHRLTLRAKVFSTDGSKVVSAFKEIAIDSSGQNALTEPLRLAAQHLGEATAELLKAQGAAELIEQARK